MLGVNSYSVDFIASCSARIDRQLAAYDALVAGAKSDSKAEFDREFFATLVLALDHCFMHRLRKNEGKDGNPLNEVRMLAASLLENGGVLKEDSTIKYSAAKSVTGLALGSPIVLDRQAFERLAQRFFEEIAAKYR